MNLSDLAPLATLVVATVALHVTLEAGLTAALVRRNDLLDDGW